MSETTTEIRAETLQEIEGDIAARLTAIDEVIQSVRPAIQRDGGDIEFVCVEGEVVRVRLTGACVHCSLAAQTLGGIRREISRRLGLSLRVLPAPSE